MKAKACVKARAVIFFKAFLTKTYRQNATFGHSDYIKKKKKKKKEFCIFVYIQASLFHLWV